MDEENEKKMNSNLTEKPLVNTPGLRPKVSIITVCYNAANTIAHTIESVLQQDYQDIEYLVLDGNSTDGTQEKIAPYLDRIAYYHSKPDNGLYDALNKALELAQGDIIGIIHADDFYTNSGVIARVVASFRKFKTDAIYSDLMYVNPSNVERVIRYWRSGSFKPSRFLNGWMPPHPTVFLKRSVYDECGNFDTEFKSAADYELMLRVFYVMGKSAKYIPGVTVKMRSGGMSNRNLQNRVRANGEDRKAWKKHGLVPPAHTIFVKPLRKIPQYIPTFGLFQRRSKGMIEYNG